MYFGNETTIYLGLGIGENLFKRACVVTMVIERKRMI